MGDFMGDSSKKKHTKEAENPENPIHAMKKTNAFEIEKIFESVLSTFYRALIIIQTKVFKSAYDYTAELLEMYLPTYYRKNEYSVPKVLACAKEWKGQTRNSLIKSLLSMQIKLENMKFSALIEEKLDYYSFQIFDFLSENSEEFDAETIAISSNFLAAGGIMVILVPETSTQEFLKYFIQNLQNYENCFLIDSNIIEQRKMIAYGKGLLTIQLKEDISSILVNSFEPKKINPQIKPFISKRKFSGLSKVNTSQFNEIIKMQGNDMTEDEYVNTLALTDEQIEFLDIIFPFMSPYKLPDKKLEEFVADKKIVFLYGTYGSGKSTAIALYLFRLSLEKENNTLKEIIITSTKINHIQSIFKKIENYLTEKNIKFKLRKDTSGTIFEVKTSSFKIEFIKCEDLISNKKNKADMIIIDEAGYIPIKHVEAMILSSNRIIILNTNNGYRSTGNVLQHKLYNRIYSLAETHNWLVKELLFNLCSLYHQKDPLEQFFNRIFFLENICPSITREDLDEDEFVLIPLQSKDIIIDSKPFFELFGILNNSFYINSVKLLQRTVEDKSIRMFALYESQNREIMLAGIITEYQGTAMDPTDRYDSVQFEHDKEKNDIPTILSTHYMEENFKNRKSARILRFAKNPMIQNDFIGSKCISLITQFFDHEKIDYISASFNSSPGLIRFWIRNDFIPIHIFLEKEGLWDYRVIQVHPLNDKMLEMFMINNIRFRKKILFWLRNELKNINPLSAFLLFTIPLTYSNKADERNLSDFTLKRLVHYFNQQMEYHYVSDAINELIEEALVYQNIPEVNLTTQQKMLIILKIQGKSDTEISQALSIDQNEIFQQYYKAIKAIYEEISMKRHLT